MNRKKLLFLGKSGLSNLTVWLLVILFQPVVFAQSQAIYSLYTPPGFPAQYQSDYISLLQQGTSQKWNTAEIQNRVSKGIILQLADHANFTAKESYRIETNGNSLLTITSSSTEGLIFGMYKHLRSLGYKFYLPGTLYTLIPSLQNPFGPKKNIVDKPFLQVRDFSVPVDLVQDLQIRTKASRKPGSSGKCAMDLDLLINCPVTGVKILFWKTRPRSGNIPTGWFPP